MKRFRRYVADNRPYILLVVAALAILTWLMLYRLGSLVGGLGAVEHSAVVVPFDWHSLFHNTLYLPLKAVRSIDFYLSAPHNLTLIRLPNVLFGALSVISFSWLVWLWHGRRTALFASVLFATSAWVLHASRLASFDVLYLWALPTLLLMNVALQRRPEKVWSFYGNMLLWGLLIYVPGMIWLVLVNSYCQRKVIAKGWQHFNTWWQRLVYVLAGAIWLPVLINNLRNADILHLWLGLPVHLAPPLQLAKNFGNVLAHLFISGPRSPELWLGRAPILDVFTLAMCVAGIYFYVIHPRASRTRLLGILFLTGTILVALGGPVGISLLVPLLYVVAATGITYLLKEWLQFFPLNPLARSIGISLVAIAVVLACTYNLRAYFVAWPYNNTTKSVFRYRP